MDYPIYLDNNATTPLDPQVMDAMERVLRDHFGNPSSHTHVHGWYAEELVKIARERVAALVNCLPEEIVFTSGATEANNLALQGALTTPLLKGPVTVVTARTEHKSVLDTLAHLEKRGLRVSYLNLSTDGSVDYTLNSALQNGTPFLISTMVANNEIGVLHNLTEIFKHFGGENTLLHSDGTQALGKLPIDLKKLPVSSMSFSAHKLYGPKGVGALFVRANVRHKIESMIHGGNHEFGLRAGTLNVPGIVGFGKACEIAARTFTEDAKRLNSFCETLLLALSAKVPGVIVNGPETNRLPGNLNISFSGVDNARLIGEISSKLSISTSSACTSALKVPSYVLAALGLPLERQSSAIRIGVGRFNTEKDITDAVEIIASAINSIRGV